jgi:hypothetical protein
MFWRMNWLSVWEDSKEARRHVEMFPTLNVSVAPRQSRRSKHQAIDSNKNSTRSRMASKQGQPGSGQSMSTQCIA